MKRTKVDASLEAAADAHHDDPERAELLTRARRFKSSWIELAEGLTDVRKSGRWRSWGYGSFEEYAKGELHLRQETVDKLTGSFLFLKKSAPEVLLRDGVNASIPSYNSVDFLRKAESQEGAPVAMVDEIRRRVIDEGTPLPALTKQYRDTVFPIDEGARKERDAAALKNVATRLRELLGETKAVPKRLAGEVADSLTKLLSELGVDQEKAA